MKKIILKTLTPLWTGGVNGRCDRLHETGIIGSLRWWCEVVVRGLGGGACDPTSQDRCPAGEDTGKEERFCSVCALFGATGLKRAFRIDFGDELINSNFGEQLKIKVSGNRGWYLGRGLFLDDAWAQGKLLVERVPPAITEEGVLQIMALILKLAGEWGE